MHQLWLQLRYIPVQAQGSKYGDGVSLQTARSTGAIEGVSTAGSQRVQAMVDSKALGGVLGGVLGGFSKAW